MCQCHASGGIASVSGGIASVGSLAGRSLAGRSRSGAYRAVLSASVSCQWGDSSPSMTLEGAAGRRLRVCARVTEPPPYRRAPGLSRSRRAPTEGAGADDFESTPVTTPVTWRPPCRGACMAPTVTARRIRRGPCKECKEPVTGIQPRLCDLIQRSL
jgi:hypothetical protein